MPATPACSADVPSFVFHDAPAEIEVIPPAPRPGRDGVRDAAEALCKRLGAWLPAGERRAALVADVQDVVVRADRAMMDG